MPKITPFLWYDTQAEEAANLYCSIFPNSKIKGIQRFGEMGPTANVVVVDFELDGQPFTAMSAGPEFKFNESISFVIDCNSQEEVDKYWNALTADGGEESMCGWLKDKYGVSWQVVPVMLNELMMSSDKAAAERATQAMLGMQKLVIADLQAAYDGK